MSKSSILLIIITFAWAFNLTEQGQGQDHTITSDNNTNNLKLSATTTNDSSNKTVQHNKQEVPSTACLFEEPSLKSFIFVVIFILIFLVGFCGNCIAFVVILISKPLRAIPSNLFLAALTLSDIGAITFIIPVRLDAYFHSGNFCFTKDVCRMFNITDSLFHVASMSHLYLIAVERFVAVCNPFFYQRCVSTKTTLVCIISTWIYAVVWACLSLFDWENPMNSSTYILEKPIKRLCLINNKPFYHVSYFTVYIIPLMIMGLLYLSILRIALKQARVIKSLSVVCKQNDDNESERKSRKQQKEVRATKTLAIIYGSFVICWLPVSIISITAKYYPNKYINFRLKQPVLFEIIFSTFVKVLPTLNSALNPFLYIMFNKKFQHELNKLYNAYGRPTPSPSSLSRLVGAGVGSDTTINPSTIGRKATFLEINQYNEDSNYKHARYLRPSIVKYEKNKDGGPIENDNNDGNQHDSEVVSIAPIN